MLAFVCLTCNFFLPHGEVIWYFWCHNSSLPSCNVNNRKCVTNMYDQKSPNRREMKMQPNAFYKCCLILRRVFFFCSSDMYSHAKMVLNTSWTATYLDCGTVLSTKRNIAFSEGNWILFLMIHINWATVMSDGTKYFLLSISTIWDPDTFSTITCKAHVKVRLFRTGRNRQLLIVRDRTQYCTTWFYNCTETYIHIYNGTNFPVPVHLS